MTDQNQEASTLEEEADVTDEQIFNEIAAAEKSGEPLNDRGAANDEETADNSFDGVDDDGTSGDDDFQASTDDNDDATLQGAADTDSNDVPDIWAGSTPAAKKAYEEMEQRLNRGNGTVSGLQKKINDLEDRLAAAAAQATVEAEDDGDEDLDRVASEYPEVAAPLIKQIQKLQQRLDGAVEQTRATEHNMISQVYVAEQQKFLETHGDGFDVVRNNLDEFQSWVDDQPRAIRDAYEANKDEMTDANSAIELVSAFKGYLNGDAQSSSAPNGVKPNSELSNKRRRQLGGARSISNRGNAPSDPSAGGGTEDERYWNDFARRDKERERAANR